MRYVMTLVAVLAVFGLSACDDNYVDNPNVLCQGHGGVKQVTSEHAYVTGAVCGDGTYQEPYYS